MKIEVILEDKEGGGYSACVPTLPGCTAEGETKEEALKNIRDAIKAYTEPEFEEDDELSEEQLDT